MHIQSICSSMPLAFAISMALAVPAIAQPASGSSATSPQQASAAKTSSTKKTSSEQKKPKTLQTVTVVGRDVLSRSSTQSLAPVDVLSASDLQSTGAPNIAYALRTLLPSFNFPQGSERTTASSVAPASLRGLPPDAVIVLINGKRVHTTSQLLGIGGIGNGQSPVDMSMIPTNAVAAVRILRSGASTQFGSGAIAGVIDIILKNGGGHGSVHVSRGIYGKDQGHNWTGGANAGFWLGKAHNGWVNVTLNYVNQHITNYGGPDLSTPGDPSFGTVDVQYGIPLTRARKVAVNMQYDLGLNATLYAFDVFRKQQLTNGALFQSTSLIRSKNPAILTLFPHGTLPFAVMHSLDNMAVIGVRGLFAGWNYDVSADIGWNHTKIYSIHTFNFSLGADSPKSFYSGTQKLSQNYFTADFSRAFDVGLAGPVSVGWGLSYAHDKYTLVQGGPAAIVGAGPQGTNRISPAEAGAHTRSHPAEYIDVGLQPIENLKLDVAARHTHFSDFGNATIWRASGRYAITPTIALRSTMGTSFLSPTMQQLYHSSIATRTLAANESGSISKKFLVEAFPTNSPAAEALGQTPLRPTKSRNISLGVVLTPANGLTATIDAYRIKSKDVIVDSSTLIGPAVVSYLESQGIPLVDGGTFFTNGVTTRTLGLDAVVTKTIQFDSSSLSLSLAGNYGKTQAVSVRQNPPQLGLAGISIPLLSRSTVGYLTGPNPRSKVSLSGNWNVEHWIFGTRVTRYGQWQVLSDDPELDERAPGNTLVNFSVEYRTKRWSFGLLDRNAFNQRPPRIGIVNSFGGLLPYERSAPYGFSGHYLVGTVRYRW